jgi:geranylgeranyl pyrophosphate synthase
VSALGAVDTTPGLAAYMAQLEAALVQAVARREGPVAAVSAEALAAGGKRLRPLVCFLAHADDDGDPPLAAGVATELVHMATLVHDDLVDGARMRRGAPAAWSVFGAGSALAAGDYLFACAFAELAQTGDSEAVGVLAGACLDLARGEAMQRSQTRRPDTTIAAYLERCALKTGKLFEAACRLGSGGDRELGQYGLALGIAFQIVDDILDCAGQTQETGKIPGTDLREGTPTMPLLLAAQQDEVVRRALAGGPLEDGALARVGATDALARSRETARDYAARARSHLGGAAHRDALEALTYAVVDRVS